MSLANMDTASFQFVAYGLAAAILSNFSRSRVWRSIVLMATSLAFIWLLDRRPSELAPLAGFLLIGYLGLILLRRGYLKVTPWILLGVVLLYMWLKKYTFFPEGSFLHRPYFILGLSYIFFRVLHLLIETADHNEGERIGIGAYLLYMLNFTTFISGPIQKYDDFARDQFAAEPVGLGIDVIGLQLERIVRGFFKVNVLAFVLHSAQDNGLAQLAEAGSFSQKFGAAFIVAICYPFLLYANFSGYIDIVIALARLMRLRLPENFDRPFAAGSVIEFWNRWHITLSNWLKTYVYNPLLVALMRRVPSPSAEPFLGVICFFVTFFLIGVWHGRTAEFITFGLLTGGGVAANKLWQVALTRSMGRKSYKELTRNGLYVAVSRGLNCTWFAFTLFWFWASGSEIAKIYSELGVMPWIAVWMSVWLVTAILLTAWEWLRAALLSVETADGPVVVSRYARVVYASALGLVVFVVTVLLSQPTPDIVYKGF
jgi:alginate O-acetyltransferase complex protein AlgI